VGKTAFEAELREQPATLERLIREGRGPAEEIARAVRAQGPRFAVIAARGSSDNAARYGQYVLGIRNRLLASLATPSLFTQYKAAPDMSSGLVIGISQSGQSPDIVSVVREGRRQGALTLAMTNDVDSPLASVAELVFPLRAGMERAVAATKTYTAQLSALAMLSAALESAGDAWSELEALPERAQRTIELNLDCLSEAARFRDDDRMIVVGRGYNFSTAMEITLKLKETSLTLADGYSSADFLHGPTALLGPGLPVLVVAPGSRTFDDLDAVVGLVEKREARLIALTDRAELVSQAELALPLPPSVPEWLSPVVAVLPGQLWALGLSLARGLDPDSPRGLSKVTRTR